MKTIGDLNLYTVAEIAERLNVNRRTVTNYIRDGKLRGRKFGRSWYVSEDALRDYFDEDVDAAVESPAETK